MSNETYVYTGDNVWLTGDLIDAAREQGDLINLDEYPVVEHVGTVKLPTVTDADFDDLPLALTADAAGDMILLTNDADQCVELAGVIPVEMDGSTWDVWADAGSDLNPDNCESIILGLFGVIL